jgi:hypothetical protein
MMGAMRGRRLPTVAFALLTPSGADLTSSLRSGPRLRGSTSPRLRQLLLVGQASLAVVLVAVAGLLAETLHRLSRVDTGFAQGELLVVELRHGEHRYGERQQLVAFCDELEARDQQRYLFVTQAPDGDRQVAVRLATQRDRSWSI